MGLKHAILVMALLAIMPFAYSSDVYKVAADFYANGSASLQSIEILDGLTSHFTQADLGYRMAVLAGSEELFSGNFYVSFEILADPPTEDMEIDVQRVELRAPYFQQADRMAIYHSGEQILSIPLDQALCRVDGVCGTGEDKANCPRDCVEEKGFNMLYILVPFGVAILAAAFFILRRKRA